MNDRPTFIDKTIDNYNNELTKACLREQFLKEDCQDLERELTAARAELAEMTARAASLAAHLPPDTLCGDIQKWRDKYKMAIEQRDRLAEAMRQMWPFIEEDDYPNCNTPAFNAAILKYKEALQSLTTNEQ
jgi:uncharacterized protein YydD (DUF2326 family)